jgi:hypothetical protein
MNHPFDRHLFVCATCRHNISTRPYTANDEHDACRGCADNEGDVELLECDHHKYTYCWHPRCLFYAGYLQQTIDSIPRGPITSAAEE